MTTKNDRPGDGVTTRQVPVDWYRLVVLVGEHNIQRQGANGQASGRLVRPTVYKNFEKEYLIFLVYTLETNCFLLCTFILQQNYFLSSSAYI